MTTQHDADRIAEQISSDHRPPQSDATALDLLQYVDTLRRLQENIGELIDAEARAARRAGATWGELAQALAISRQGAQQRYGAW